MHHQGRGFWRRGLIPLGVSQIVAKIKGFCHNIGKKAFKSPDFLGVFSRIWFEHGE